MIIAYFYSNGAHWGGVNSNDNLDMIGFIFMFGVQLMLPGPHRSDRLDGMECNCFKK